MMSKRLLYGTISIIVIACVFFLTFQSKKQTELLSDSVYEWLVSIGIRIDNIRSLVHVPMYYIVGLAITLFGKSSKWNTRMILMASFFIAFMDEMVKAFLPTREFDVMDLMLDCLGILFALMTVNVVTRIQKRRKQKQLSM